MPLNNNIFKSKEKFQDLINKLNLEIFDEKIWIWKELWKIAELTYSYDKETNINTTLFVSIWWLNIDEYKKWNNKKSLLLKAKWKIEKVLEEKILQIIEAKKEVRKINTDSNDNIQKDLISIFINSLNEKLKLLEYCKLALPLELEKTWINSWLNNEKEQELEEKLLNLDKFLFWWQIKENPNEVKFCYEYIYDIYKNNKDKLTQEQKNRFEFYLKKLENLLLKWYKYKEKEKPKIIDEKFLNFDLPQKDYLLWFNLLIEALEKLESVVETNQTVWSISDWPKWVQFPISEKFKNIKIIRFLKLWNHEIETHDITNYNSKQLLWNLRWKNSIEKDEWLAILMEQLFIYGKSLYKIDEKTWKLIIDINKIQISNNFVKILFWEILNNDELIEFLELSNIIEPDIISVKDRFFRLKRNNKNNVQHKDTTYTRWLLKAVKKINNYILSDWKKWIAPEDLFIWKISFEETEKLKRIKEYKINSWEKIDLIKPLFIADVIYYSIKQKLLHWKNTKINSQNFYKYLQDKYPLFNFSKEQIDSISFKTKSNINWIINILLKNISKQLVNEITKNNKKIMNILSNQYEPKIKYIANKLHPNRKNAK